MQENTLQLVHSPLLSHEHTKKPMVYVGDQNKYVIELSESNIKQKIIKYTE